VGVESHILRGPINDIYHQLKERVKVLRKPSEESVYQKGLSILNVKTIWQTDRAVSLTNFYYPSKVIWDRNIIQINSLNDFPQRQKVVIQGTAGQGKSIFLRYLTGEELKRGKQIPVFIELMKVSDKYSLKMLIANALTEYGLSCHADEVEAFLATEKFTLLLDAFDELPSEHLKDTLSYIEHLSCRFSSLNILITSRPNFDIQNSAYFVVYDLAPIQQGDFEPILGKFYKKDTPEIHKILTYLRGESHQVASLIKTPLLLTLLCITYNSTSKIPSSPYEFYQKLFHLLAERHDSTKPGFRRNFSSKLSINQLEKLFEAYSFFCMKTDSKALSINDAITKVREASSFCCITPSSESAFLNDCVKNTCLLLKEGFDYQFIHKSVMEYHAASFIKNSDSKIKIKFYSAAVKKADIYLEELKYLSYIDVENYERHFLIPFYEYLLDFSGFSGNSCNTESFYPRSFSIWFYVSGGKLMLSRISRSIEGSGVSIPSTENDLGGCFIDAIEQFTEQLQFDEEKLSFLPDSRIAELDKIVVTRENIGESEVFKINIEGLKIEFLDNLLKSILISKCKSIKAKLDPLIKRVELRDKNISELDF